MTERAQHTGDIAWELSDPAVLENPYPYLEQLRADSPVHYFDEAGAWGIARHADVQAVLKNVEMFSSEAGMDGGNALSGREMEMRDRFAGVMIPGAPTESADMQTAFRTMITSDPPEHTRLRRLVSGGFTPKKVGEMEPRIREIANMFLDKALDKDTMEIVGELSGPLPTTVIAELMGVDRERWREFKQWSDAIIVLSTGVPSQEELQKLLPALMQSFQFFQQHITYCREHPDGDDLIRNLIRAESDDKLSAGEVMSFASLLLIAGSETTTNLIGNALIMLHKHRDQFERLQKNPELLPSAIEEVLRYESPVQLIFRRATDDIEVAGTTIPQNARVLPLLGSANRDERQFPDAATFDIARKPNDHVAFGYGIHFCLGAGLARLEARVAFEELFKRVRDFELIDDTIERLNSILVRGPEKLPIRLTHNA